MVYAENADRCPDNSLNQAIFKEVQGTDHVAAFESAKFLLSNKQFYLKKS